MYTFLKKKTVLPIINSLTVHNNHIINLCSDRGRIFVFKEHFNSFVKLVNEVTVYFASQKKKKIFLHQFDHMFMNNYIGSL